MLERNNKRDDRGGMIEGDDRRRCLKVVTERDARGDDMRRRSKKMIERDAGKTCQM
jgi:hypothetical protein